MEEIVTNVQKNQLIYYGKEHINGDTTTNTEDYLEKVLDTYRNNMRNLTTNSSGIKEDEDAKLLEEVLNSIKQVQSKILGDNNISDDDILDVIAQQSYGQLLTQLFTVNPNLFKGLGLVINNSNSGKTQGALNTLQGKILENFMAEFVTTVDSAYQNMSFDIMNSTNNYHNTSSKTDDINSSNLFNFAEGIMNNGINQMQNEIARQTFNLTNKGNRKRYEQAKAQGIAQDFLIENNTRNIGSRFIKTDTVGLIGEIKITATSTILERVVSALSMATFTDKNIGKRKSIHLGNTNPARVFFTVVQGNDSYYKLYRYARMLNCFYNHYPIGKHVRAPEYFYRIRQIYELTGGQQQIGIRNGILEEKMASIVTGATKAKYLVINTAAGNGIIKVIPTSKLVDLMTARMNKKWDKATPEEQKEGIITPEKALNGKISFSIGNVLKDNFDV